MRLLAFALFALSFPPAWAQLPSETPDAGENIPVEEWRALAAGRTLTYRIGDEFWAMERYEPGTNRVTLQFWDGRCIEGVWDYSEPLYCFHWDEEGTSCFRHVRLGEDILILETLQGLDTGEVQVMTGVSDTPLACGPAVTS